MIIIQIVFRLLFLLIGIIPDGRRESHHGQAEDVEERERGERDVRLQRLPCTLRTVRQTSLISVRPRKRGLSGGVGERLKALLFWV